MRREGPKIPVCPLRSAQSGWFHLCPFALWTAFPSPLVGRDSHDYYEHCVAIGLAPHRRSHVRPCHTYKRDLGVPLISFVALLGQRPMLRRVSQAWVQSGTKHGAGFRRFPADGTLHLLEIGIQAIQLSPYHAGPPAHRSLRLDPATGFLACCCPLHLSDPGQPFGPETSLRVPPGYAGDTTKRLVAHTHR